MQQVEAPEIWVTHGREEALIHAAGLMGKRAQALALVGYEDEED
jgi:putative mRNA 3-end processing factor